MNGKYNFIKLTNVMIRNFSLFRKSGKLYKINEEINEGVYCLAGANGLGKTTFLNAINFGLTGIVLEPEKEVFSPGEIVVNNKRYTERYFIGRINKKDEKEAEIELHFKIKNKFFRIIRGFFEREELRLLEIYENSEGKKSSIFSGTNESPKELNSIFQKRLTKEIGFSTFDYFIFYQLYVLTFDENRRMIFWDERASSHALAIAFNSDPNNADRVLELARKMEKHESNARNSRWDATKAKKKIDELTQKLKSKKEEDIQKLEKEFERYHNNLEKAEQVFRNIKIEYDSMLKKQSHINSELMQLRIEHTRLFSKYSKPRSNLLENTNIQLSIKNRECQLCGSGGSHVVDSIKRNIHKEKCPLCNTIINESNNSEQNYILKLIQKNDERISKLNTELDDIILEIDGKKVELDKSEIEFSKIKKRIEEFAEDYPDIPLKGSDNLGVNTLIQQYKKQFELADQEAKNEYKQRDKLKPEYDTLLKKIENSYKDAETVFVPTFKELAKSFIGLELSIRPMRTNKSIKLILELQDLARTESFQLSESQRFFLDIALRMSLSIYLSSSKNPATMMIDTPEGSLDIAYENRVGKMFADYTISYNQNLFMTANINASQLLLSLAEICGKKRMKFRRMLDWTDLSVIQKEGEELFQKVYFNIENALNKKEI